MGLNGGGEKVDAIGIGGGGMEGPKKAVALPLDSVRRRFPCLTDWVRVRAEETLEAFIVRRRRTGEVAELTEEAEEFDDVRERLLGRVLVRDRLLEGKVMVGEAAEKTGDGDGTVRENVGTGSVDGGICSCNVG